MNARMNMPALIPEGYAAMLGLEKYLRRCGLEHGLLDLVRLRASQINGCAYCVDMHYKDARAAGESEQRLSCLTVWRESPFFTDRERAALDWAETVTLVRDTHVPDSAFEDARRVFSEKELADLTLAIATINAWNRLAISARSAPGEYQAPHKPG
jgi:AhpD family alkylhydroperoxidase